MCSDLVHLVSCDFNSTCGVDGKFLGTILDGVDRDFWHSQSTDEDQETKILRLLATLETHVTEYEAGIRALRADMIMVMKEDSHGSPPNSGGRSEHRLPSQSFLNRNRLKTASIYNALPYLLDYEEALVPALTIGKDREGVSLVIGIPTVKRPNQSYLLPTLQNLINSMLPLEKNDTLVIVFIADPDVSFVQSTVNSITKQFKRDVDSGLIEIIAPAASYYPDFKTIKGTLGDSDDRTRWRTKQNLDYAYLMMYAQHRGTYYVQIEDDVLSKKGFVNTMKSFALENSMKKRDWFMLDFCQLGFIGKLFRSSDLWMLVEFFLMFYQDKPGDWLLSHFFSVKYCKLDYSQKRCIRELNKHWIHYKPSLFQHIGMVSSLNGKVQKLKDRQFGKLELFIRHDNPEAKVESTIKHYGKFSLEKAYQGKNYFWGLAPEAGDTIKFTFALPIRLTNYRFISGNAEHPSDKLHNATLEVLPSESTDRIAGSTAVVTKDGYVVVDEFDELGVLDGQFPDNLNPIKAVRITLRNASENWVILSEILLEKG
ncbi:unnamed protein product [Allacma fusca]|uniref:Alpha-1,3-mannosyl-glycoprotein 4-beta-N-acetylglucosaminyltransferase B n=1 Tax=Allacma fusca TaxID=39272 RepID=A0A8J2P4I7_9HEXA|nr:unnamed protein product [Allacma fusca]